MQLAAKVAPAPTPASGSACEALQGTSQAQVRSPSFGAGREYVVAGPVAAKGHQQNGCGNSRSSNGKGSSHRTALHAPFLVLGVLLLALLTATAAAGSGLYRFNPVSSSSKQAGVALWWSQALSKSASRAQAVAGSSRQKSFSRHLLQTRWSLLGLRSNLLTGGILQQLLTASAQNDEAAASAAMAAASSQGRASRLLLTDLDPSTGAPGGQAPPRFLATAAQGPRGTAGQAMVPIDTDAQPLCSATINYGASVGDANNKATADVPIYVGSFDVVVTQPQSFQPAEPAEGDGSRWVIGWQFAAGEYLQVSRDVFGDEGIQRVFMSPSAQGPAEGAEEVPGLPPNRGTLGQTPQRVAVFSNTSLGGSNGEVVFSFVGRKGPERPILQTAPFRVAPPTNVFLNNHYCWPLFRPSSSSGNSPAAIAAAAGSGAAVGKAPGAPGQQAPQQQMQMVEVATPQLEPANMPRQLQVEYLPVEFAAKDDDPALFAKTVTQFYFKITNQATEPVFLDQVLLQYWFHGPLDGTLEDTPGNSTAGGASGVTDVAARVSTSQFRLTCSDASPDIGCGGLAWNVTPGLPSAFGARYVLNVWFPAPASNGSNSSSDGPQRFVLLPAGSNSSVSSNSTAGTVQTVTGPDGKPLLQQSLTDMQAIVAIEPRRFFANISATNDYSFADTPVLGPPPGSNSSAGDGGQLVRRRREPNSRMPAYVSQKLAWGSPPVVGRMAPRPGSSNSTAGAKSIYPPGSYCQPSAGGGMVCGIDVLYCCLGSGALNLTSVPPDWPTRLTSGINPVTGGNGTGVGLNPAGLVGADPGASGKSGLDPWALALAVALPIAAVLAAAAGGGMAYVRRRRRRADRFKPFADSSSNGSRDGGDVLTDLQRPPGPPGPAGWVPVGEAGAGDNPSLLAALLSPHGSQQGPGWTGAGLDAAERGQGAMYGLQGQQQLAEWQLLHAQQAAASAGSQSQLYYTAGMSAAVAAARPQRQLLRVLKPKVTSLPGDMIAAAARFAKQEHLRQMGSRSSGDGDGPGSPFAEASRAAFVCGVDFSQDVQDAVEQDVRCHTWTGRLHEDAFKDDLLDQLLNIHMRPQLMTTTAAPGSPTNTDGVWSHLQQQQQGQHPLNGAGAAAAAVEAAVAAINALLSGTVGMPRPPTPALSRYPGRAKGSSSSAGDRPGSPQGPAGSPPSFYKALMATGGVLRPPGGPPIPLNVDYVTEIQPNLGRLLGRGGYGHVYEATWRGQRVAVKLLTVDTEDPAVLDAFLKEVALCACLRGCDRVVRLLGACLGSCGTPPTQLTPPPPSAAGTTAAGSTYHTSSTISTATAVPGAGSVLPDNPSVDITPFQSQLPPDVAADDTPPGSTSGGPQQPQQQWALIMELVEGGNLAHRIYHPSKRSLSYLEILQVGLDIASGLAYLHPAVVHRDLKPQNVLLDKQGRAKIADFGISRFKDPHRSYLSVTHQGGTPNYMAPELFNASRVDEAADVYSMGCILYECLAKQQPFSHLAEDGKSFNVLFKIIVAVAINKERPPLPHDTPPCLASLILRCWSENPTGRPRVDQLLAELEDMMREALQERAEQTGQLRRMSSISSRSQRMGNKQYAARKDSTGSITSNASSATGSNSPSRAGQAVRGAQTLPTPVPPHNSLASSLAAGSDSNVSGSMWPPPLAGSHSGSQHSGALSRRNGIGNGGGSVLTLPSGVMPLPSIGAAIAARISRASSSRRDSLEDPAAAETDGAQGFSLSLQTGAAAVRPAYGAGQCGRGSRRGSSSSEVDQAGPSSPRPFQEQQLLMLQQQQHSHHHNQQQQLRPSGSIASSGYSRSHWQCPCFGSPEPCAACAGSTSSSDCGSSNGGGGSSGGSMHRTPTSISPVHMSPTGGRQLHVLPEIPQDTPAAPVQLPSYAAAVAEDNPSGVDHTARVQLTSLQPALLRPKASVASPQTPARSAHVGRKPSQLSSNASGALFTTEGSLPAGALGNGHGSSDLQYPTPAPTAATAYPALLYPLHTDNVAAATAAAFGGQPAALTQPGLVRSGSGGSSSKRLRQQQRVGLPRQPSGGLPRPWMHPVAPGSHAGASGGSSGSSSGIGGAVLAAGTPAAAASLSSQRSGVLPRHSQSNSSGSSNGSAGSVVLRVLGSGATEAALPLEEVQQQERQGSGVYSTSMQRKVHEQQQGGAGVLRTSSSLHPSMARSTSSVPSEPAATGELSSSQSSSPSAVTGSVVAASVYSCGSGISSSCNASRLRSASLDFSSTSLYTNPLFGLGVDSTWQPPALQMQHSAPAMGRAGRSLAAAAVERSALSMAAAAAEVEAGSPRQHAAAHSVARHPGRVDSADTVTASSTTVFMTAKSNTAGAAGSADAAAAAEGLGDFSLHGNGNGHGYGSAGTSRLARVSSDTAAAHARDAGQFAVAAAKAGGILAGKVQGEAAAAAAAGHAGHHDGVGVAVARKVSFADADEVVG